MTDRVEKTCLCCRTLRVVDTGAGEVLSEQRPKAGGKSFEAALHEVRGGAAKREEAFSKAFDRTRNLDNLLEKKFEEARKKTKDNDSRPTNPMDLD